MNGRQKAAPIFSNILLTVVSIREIERVVGEGAYASAAGAEGIEKPGFRERTANEIGNGL